MVRMSEKSVQKNITWANGDESKVILLIRKMKYARNDSTFTYT